MSDAGQPGWPNGVTPIQVPDLKRLGINEQNELFWDGRHVEIRRSLTLTRFQKFITIIVTFCAVLGALGGFVTGFNNASVFLCARHVTFLTCPAP
ncbi:MAG: hypothetical protein WA863_15145 [Methyloceanibacter sp.]|jgi:hypothetical protein